MRYLQHQKCCGEYNTMHVETEVRKEEEGISKFNNR